MDSFIPSTPGPVRDQLLALVREAAERADDRGPTDTTDDPSAAFPTAPWERTRRTDAA